MTRSSASFLAICGCFFLSGFAALVYQTAWLRQFSLVFGTAELAVAIVLASYMAGLGIGAAWGARLAPRVRRPIRVYGWLELGIALGALAVPLGMAAARSLYEGWFGGQPEPVNAGSWGQALFFFVSTLLVVLVPTIFMGATLPVLTRHAVHEEGQIGRRTGTLYAINTTGAVFGTVVAAFWLLPWLGLTGTVWVGVSTNAAVFVLAAFAIAPRSTAAEEPLPTMTRGWHRESWVLPIMLISGATAFVYEVLWTRLLSHFLGGSLYAFATMLASVLTGIALGSALAAVLSRHRRGAIQGLVVAQFAVALSALGAFIALDWLPGLVNPATSSSGFGFKAFLSGLLLFPMTLAVGATFPFAVRILVPRPEETARGSGRVFAWNTVGAILGAAAAGFILIPDLGYVATLRIATATNLLLAVAACAILPGNRAGVLGVAALGILVCVAPQPGLPLQLLRISPVTGIPADGEVRFLAAGRSATVLLLEKRGQLEIRTNGMTEISMVPKGSPPGHMQQMLSSLPVLARPDARTLQVIGFGGGIAVRGAPPSVREIDAIEIEPSVLEANRICAPFRLHDPLADPRLKLFVNDARNVLSLTTKRYDIIVSQPSHPWTAGSSHLYTQQFFEQVRDHLNPEGVFTQWMNSSLIDLPLLRSVGATLATVFQHVQLYHPGGSMLLFLASDGPLDPLERAPEALSANRDHYTLLGVDNISDVAAMRVLDESGMKRFVKGAPVSTDDDNLLATRSPVAVRTLALAALDEALAPFDPLMSTSTLDTAPLDASLIVRGLIARGLLARAERLTSISRDPVSSVKAQALLQNARGQAADANLAFQKVLSLDPEDADAQFGLLEPWLPVWSREPLPPRLREIRDELTGANNAVISGWEARLDGDWAGLAALEIGLAGARPWDLCYAYAAELRAGWRTHVGEKAGANEAIAIIDRALVRHNTLNLYLARLQAAEAADRPHVWLETADILCRDLVTRAPTVPRRELEIPHRTVLESVGRWIDDPRIPRHRVDLILEDLRGL